LPGASIQAGFFAPGLIACFLNRVCAR